MRVIYSDVRLFKNKKLTNIHKCDHNKLVLNHQCFIYSKNLHDEYGLYFVAPKVSISDYIFFSLIDKNRYLKSDKIIADYDLSGISQSKKAVEQKFIVDYLLNGLPKFKFIIFFLFYYYKIKLQKLSWCIKWT